jgi:Serine dehydratase beta chain/Serine dehydratase alpha chain
MKSEDAACKDALLPDPELGATEVPDGIARRAFMMRGTVAGAVAVIAGCSPPPVQQPAASTAAAAPPAPKDNLSPDLEVVKKSRGPVMTTLDEFYKVGPGPSSSHTFGPMRITYDFYQRCTKLPADQLAKATGIKVHLYGSLSATGKGHGTERAALAGIIGKEPATVEPEFLDSLVSNPDQTFPVKLGDKTFNASLKDIVYDSAKGEFPHPNTYDFPPQVVANAAESSLQHHLGMTCDPVAGYVQIPCIEFGAVKAFTGFMIASNEIPTNRRVDVDTTVSAMALTAKEMNTKYKETSEGGLAVSLVLC